MRVPSVPRVLARQSVEAGGGVRGDVEECGEEPTGGDGGFPRPLE
jgi:hypothetical protein